MAPICGLCSKPIVGRARYNGRPEHVACPIPVVHVSQARPLTQSLGNPGRTSQAKANANSPGANGVPPRSPAELDSGISLRAPTLRATPPLPQQPLPAGYAAREKAAAERRAARERAAADSAKRLRSAANTNTAASAAKIAALRRDAGIAGLRQRDLDRQQVRKKAQKAASSEGNRARRETREANRERVYWAPWNAATRAKNAAAAAAARADATALRQRAGLPVDWRDQE